MLTILPGTWITLSTRSSSTRRATGPRASAAWRTSLVAGRPTDPDLAPPPPVDRDREHHARPGQRVGIGQREGDVVDLVDVPEPFPELGGDVRRQRRHHQHQRLESLAGGGATVAHPPGDGVVETGRAARWRRCRAARRAWRPDRVDASGAAGGTAARRRPARPPTRAPGRSSSSMTFRQSRCRKRYTPTMSSGCSTARSTSSGPIAHLVHAAACRRRTPR